MPTTTERGYGRQHQRARAAALAALQPGTPCGRCGQPMFKEQKLDLDHQDNRTTYRGLAHARCNRAAGGRLARARQARRLAVIRRPQWRSRAW